VRRQRRAVDLNERFRFQIHFRSRPCYHKVHRLFLDESGFFKYDPMGAQLPFAPQADALESVR
jgi:hypothetical protein